MWSAGWTHPHKGVTPNVGDKYIVTGWCEYFEHTTRRDTSKIQIRPSAPVIAMGYRYCT